MVKDIYNSQSHFGRFYLLGTPGSAAALALLSVISAPPRGLEYELQPVELFPTDPFESNKKKTEDLMIYVF